MKTEELVYSFLDKLDPAKDEFPSVRAIREKIGRGSYGTINDAVRNWKKTHAFAKPIRMNGDIELDEASLREFAKALNAVFGPVIRTRVDRVVQESEQKIASLTDSLNDTRQQLEEEVKKSASLRQELERLRIELENERLARAKAEGALEVMTRSGLVTSSRD